MSLVSMLDMMAQNISATKKTVTSHSDVYKRQSLHNLSFIEDLELMPGNRILVSKRNMIIPHVEENMDRGGFNLEAAFPHQCPCCGQPTRVHETKGRDENGKERIIKTLFCDNAP